MEGVGCGKCEQKITAALKEISRVRDAESTALQRLIKDGGRRYCLCPCA
ncbi:MAG: cation transporter [Lachnospiraceae bacterium]|nr:cation transporter [Lachnospiraceae bacterium]